MAALAAEDGNQAFWRVRLLVDLAGAETERGDPAGALVTLAEAFGIEAHTLPTREHNQGVALLRLGRVEEALRSFDEALAVRRRYAPNFAAGTKDHRREVGDTFCGRGHALLLLGRAEEALPAFEQAIALHPDCLDALAALEALLRAAGRIKESDRALARLTKKRA
jgi:tetratricopeptide (TPR) repeat protein